MRFRSDEVDDFAGGVAVCFVIGVVAAIGAIIAITR